MAKNKIFDEIADDFQDFVLTGFDLGFTAKQLKNIVKYAYDLDVGLSTIYYQKPKNRERQLNYRRRSRSSVSRELLEVPYRITNKGRRFFDLGMIVDGGYEYSSHMVILQVLNEFASTKNQILDVFKKTGYYLEAPEKNAFQLKKLDDALSNMERKGLVEPVKYFPEWMFGWEFKPFIPDWLFDIDGASDEYSDNLIALRVNAAMGE